MSLLLVMPGRDTEPVRDALRRASPGLDVRVWPDVGDPARVLMAVTWNHPPGCFDALPALRVISSYGAGVDHLLRDPRLPAGVPVVRVVDPNLVQDMVEYAVGAVCAWRRGFEVYRQRQQRAEWVPVPYDRDRSALVLGLGELGGAVARALAGIGFDVSGWSRTPKAIRDVRCQVGRDALEAALPAAAAVVCLLPLTPATEGILDRRLLARFRPGSLLLNLARGAHVVESDLLEALDRGRPAAAWMDVFADEPLPPEHPFWRHPAVTVTPHVASLTDPDSVAVQLVATYRRAESGGPFRHVVDPARGY